MEHHSADLKIAFCADGIRVEIYDTYCKAFDQKDKERFDNRVHDILSHTQLRAPLEHCPTRGGDRIEKR